MYPVLICVVLLLVWNNRREDIDGVAATLNAEINLDDV